MTAGEELRVSGAGSPVSEAAESVARPVAEAHERSERERDDAYPAASAAGAFGRWLIQERELRGLGRDEVARLTKLGPAVISALESGDPGRMPPKAYVFGYLRSYAAVVGLDADDVVLRWQEVVGPEEPAQAGRRRPPPMPWSTVLVAAIAIAVLALLVAVLAGPRRRAPLKLERPRAVERGPYEAAPPVPGR